MRLSTMLGWIGGIALVLALTSPLGYGNQKDAAKRTACLSNLKQQSLGLLQYASDGHQGFPSRDAWMDRPQSYVKDERILRDPVSYRDGVSASYGYAFNATLSKRPLVQGAEPIPLVYDSVNPIRNASDPFTSLPTLGRHKGRNNVADSEGRARAVAVR